MDAIRRRRYEDDLMAPDERYVQRAPVSGVNPPDL